MTKIKRLRVKIPKIIEYNVFSYNTGNKPFVSCSDDCKGMFLAEQLCTHFNRKISYYKEDYRNWDLKPCRECMEKIKKNENKT